MSKNKNLVRCKSCSHKVARMADKCPGCGVSNPSLKGSHVAIGFGILFVVVGAFSLTSTDKSTTTKTYLDKKDQECNTDDLRCVAESKEYYANISCPYHIEEASLYDHDWRNGLSSKFKVYGWGDDKKSVRYLGDQLKFTNGFNAKINMKYECIIDINTNEVISVDVQKGRFNYDKIGS